MTFRFKRGSGNMNSLYFAYKAKAKMRRLKFRLCRTKFFDLVTSPCTYCGTPPKQVWNRHPSKFTDPFLYNGIDRMDNLGGYVEGNSVPCCKTCNYAKRIMSHSEWIEYLDQLVSFRTKKNYSGVSNG